MRRIAGENVNIASEYSSRGMHLTLSTWLEIVKFIETIVRMYFDFFLSRLFLT